MKPRTIDELFDEPPENIRCRWCGRVAIANLEADDCLCYMCKDCNFIHDVSRCRSGVVLFHGYWIDDSIHAIHFADERIAIPVCWPYENHEKPLPLRGSFLPTEKSVNCLQCIAEAG